MIEMTQLPDPATALDKAILNTRIRSVEFFRLDRKLANLYYTGKSDERDCCLLKISSGNCAGLGECITPDADYGFNLDQWASILMKLKNSPIIDALNYVRNKAETWDTFRVNLVESALNDLVQSLLDPLLPRHSKMIPWEHDFLINHSRAYIIC